MLGPAIAWYLVVGSAIFAIGAAGANGAAGWRGFEVGLGADASAEPRPGLRRRA